MSSDTASTADNNWTTISVRDTVTGPTIFHTIRPCDEQDATDEMVQTATDDDGRLLWELREPIRDQRW